MLRTNAAEWYAIAQQGFENIIGRQAYFRLSKPKCSPFPGVKPTGEDELEKGAWGPFGLNI